jgi:2-C-methyl-D-erythritol 4-phosphate cytidylyltransferase
MVHDAVRPLCDRETMQRALDAAWVHGGAVPALPAMETIQRVSRRGRHRRATNCTRSRRPSASMPRSCGGLSISPTGANSRAPMNRPSSDGPATR